MTQGIDKSAKVISLSLAKARYRPQRCEHLLVEVDHALSEVECRDCGEKLNPVAVLVRLATEETRRDRQIQELKERREKLEQRSRCKCQHCGQMTRIKV